MALTEQDFEDGIRKNLGVLNDTMGRKRAAKAVYEAHQKECERMAELAFNAGRETQNYDPDDVDTFTIPKYETYQKYKDSI